MSDLFLEKWHLFVDDECASCQKAKAIKIVLDERGYNVIISCECPLCVFEYDTDNLPVVVGTTANDILKMIADIIKENNGD